MMYQNRMRQTSGGTHEINVTPLVDISLVLVVILLLAAPLAFESSIGVRAGEAQGRAAFVATEGSTTEITLLSETEVRVNRQTVLLSDLAVTLRPLLVADGGGRVVMDTRDGITHGTFVAVLDEAKRCGAVDIAVAGR
jgi:biopolymer transport protein ExbD